jgi:hypothetical protein
MAAELELAVVVVLDDPGAEPARRLERRHARLRLIG